MSDLRAPFPYFGGKSRVSDVVWKAFGTRCAMLRRRFERADRHRLPHVAQQARRALPREIGCMTSFRNANLENAVLSHSDLRGLDFSGANLRYANLARCDLRGAKFDGADLTEAYMVGVIVDHETGPLGGTSA